MQSMYGTTTGGLDGDDEIEVFPAALKLELDVLAILSIILEGGLACGLPFPTGILLFLLKLI